MQNTRTKPLFQYVLPAILTNTCIFLKVIFRGLPEMIAQLATPVTTICLNHVLIATLADEGVNTFAVISYVASFAMSVLFGVSEGLQPLFGKAYGAKEEKDLKFYFHSRIVISVVGSARACRNVCPSYQRSVRGGGQYC